MITSLQVKFENCYGIKRLEHSFNFSQKHVISIYAPNGTMKTSFAKTFKDFSEGQNSSDFIFREIRPTFREIKDQTGLSLDAKNIFVIEPYVESYKSEGISTLLVNSQLKETYEQILKKIEKEKSIFISKLKQLSGLTARNNPIEKEISKVFGSKDFLEVLLKLEDSVNNTEEHPFSSIIYSKIFDEKVVTFLETKDFKKQISEYINKYDELIQKSKYLKKGFNHSNVTEIHKKLKENGFFKANHSVNLYNGVSNDVIVSEDELQQIIAKEIELVLNDSEIQKQFNEIDSKLITGQLKEFRDYLFDNKFILEELINLNKFKKDVWMSYFVEQKTLFNNLLQEYKVGKAEIENIVSIARNEQNDWRDVINIFNKRFSVPFILDMENQEDVILKSESPNLKFVFQDSILDVEKQVEEADLLKVLSQGERRALYILNIIFEVRARVKNSQETIFIIDDIADSFDYKNKYAIIEYLKEISEEPIFKQIILTHNFDFHRTVCSRLNMCRSNKLNTLKSNDRIILIEEKYSKNNPFLHWKQHLDINQEMLVAAIPFVRNLAEYSGHSECYDILTSLLHYKENTNVLRLEDLEQVIKQVLVDKSDLILPNPNKLVIDVVFEVADSILQSTDEIVDLENKISLAIAIRLKAEQFMVLKISDDVFWKQITSKQTFELIRKYKVLFPDEETVIGLLEQVNLMTPENIHLNSFMYEPILDMSNDFLKKLYLDVKTHLG